MTNDFVFCSLFGGQSVVHLQRPVIPSYPISLSKCYYWSTWIQEVPWGAGERVSGSLHLSKRQTIEIKSVPPLSGYQQPARYWRKQDDRWMLPLSTDMMYSCSFTVVRPVAVFVTVNCFLLPPVYKTRRNFIYPRSHPLSQSWAFLDH